MQMFAVIKELWETQCGPEARPAASCIPKLFRGALHALWNAGFHEDPNPDFAGR